MKDNFTIEEVITITGISKTTIYRNIKNGYLKTIKEKTRGRDSYLVTYKDLEEFIKLMGYPVELSRKVTGNHETITGNHETITGNHETITGNHETITGNHEKPLTEETLINAIESYFTAKQSQLIKPLEDQALYRLGILENEVKHLHAEKETLRQENELLREQVKALPGPGELEAKENIILSLKMEKEELLTKVEDYKHLPEKLEDTVRKLQDKEDEIKELETKLKREKEEIEARLLSEKDEAMKEQVEETQRQKEELESKLKVEEEEKAKAKAEAEQALKQLKELPAPVESIQQILLDNANNIKALAKEKDNFQSVLKENEATIKEKERALKELDELRRQELEKLKQEHETTLKLMSESAEKEKIEIVEAWKKKTEELERPWWKFW